MIRIPNLPLAALAAALVLSGCVTANSTFVGTYYPSYQVGVGTLAAGDGPVPVTVTGAPISNAAIVAALNALPNRDKIQFTTDQKTGRSGYRLALNFGMNQPNSCAPNTTAALPFPDEPGNLRLSAAFCRFGGELSRTTGRTPVPTRPDSPEFQLFMRSLLAELLPPFQPNPNDSGSCFSRVC